MFDTRINQGINYGFFGAIKDLPEGWRLFSGYISKITEVHSDNNSLKIEEIDLTSGDNIGFTKDQIFACVRLS